MPEFDCSELFPGYEKADCRVIEDLAHVRLWQSGTYSTFEMNVDRIQNFLEKCRTKQEPRFYHLVDGQTIDTHDPKQGVGWPH